MASETALKPGVKDRWIAKLKEVGPERRAGAVLADGAGNMCCLGWLLVAEGLVADPTDTKATKAHSASRGNSYLNKKTLRAIGLSEVDGQMLAGINDCSDRFPIREIKALREAPSL